MSSEKSAKQFPDLNNKLAAPTKKSQFERSKADAEAKRLREAAETAAVYEDFVKSFDDDDAPSKSENEIRQKGINELDPAGPKLGGGGPSKRHFVSSVPKQSGPGSLGPPPSTLGKRSSDGVRLDEREKERGLFAFDDTPPAGPLDAATAFKTSDDEDEDVTEKGPGDRAPSKPTIQMLSLPPGSSPAIIKALLPPAMVVDSVRILPPQGPGVQGSIVRKSTSAIVTLARDTPGSEIDSAVNTLQNRYLGWGYYLSLSRHLSSSVLATNLPGSSLNANSSSLPFGARELSPQGARYTLSRALPPSQRGGIPPPSSYAPSKTGPRGSQASQVTVNPPTSVKQLKLIHKTIEAVLEHGPEFEALLMSRPEVQRDRKWAWLWDARSIGGVWYRWRLWEIKSGFLSERKRHYSSRLGNSENHVLFEGGAPWAEPEEDLAFEFTTNFEELVEESDYDSSEEEESDEEAVGGPRKRRRMFEGAPAGINPALMSGADIEEQTYLNPMQKAKLTYLLRRLPSTTARLRRGDVARITAFAISHADAGADEIVDLLATNVIQPFSCFGKMAQEDEDSDSENRMQDDPERNDFDNTSEPDEAESKKEDTSSACLIGLHIISDILSSSSNSGVRHSWRYRTLFETALAKNDVFPRLGRLEKDLSWGRLRAEKWRRSVHNVLEAWQQCCYFSSAVQDTLRDSFDKPPVTEEEQEQDRRREDQEKKERATVNSKWKSVDLNQAARVEESAAERTAEEPNKNDSGKDLSAQPTAFSGRRHGRAKNEKSMDGPTNGRSANDHLIEKIRKEDGHTDLARGATPNEMTSREDKALTTPRMRLQNNIEQSNSGIQNFNRRLPPKKRPTAEDMFASDEE